MDVHAIVLKQPPGAAALAGSGAVARSGADKLAAGSQLSFRQLLDGAGLLAARRLQARLGPVAENAFSETPSRPPGEARPADEDDRHAVADAVEPLLPTGPSDCFRGNDQRTAVADGGERGRSAETADDESTRGANTVEGEPFEAVSARRDAANPANGATESAAATPSPAARAVTAAFVPAGATVGGAATPIAAPLVGMSEITPAPVAAAAPAIAGAAVAAGSKMVQTPVIRVTRAVDALQSRPAAGLAPNAAAATDVATGIPTALSGTTSAAVSPPTPAATPNAVAATASGTVATAEAVPVSTNAAGTATPAAGTATAATPLPANPAAEPLSATRAAPSGDVRPVEPASPTTGPGGAAPAGSERAAAAPSTAARPPHVPPRLVGDQLAVHITKAIKGGADRIDIRLTPPALGRVEINLELAADGRVRAAVTADTPQVLDALKADARGLERALQEAGLKTDAGSLSFSLRGDGGGRPHDGDDGRRQAVLPGTPPAEPASGVDTEPSPWSGRPSSDGRIDIRA